MPIEIWLIPNLKKELRVISSQVNRIEVLQFKQALIVSKYFQINEYLLSCLQFKPFQLNVGRFPSYVSKQINWVTLNNWID